MTPQAESELRRLAQELQTAIRRHVSRLRYSLIEKRAVMLEHHDGPAESKGLESE